MRHFQLIASHLQVNASRLQVHVSRLQVMSVGHPRVISHLQFI